MKKIYLTSLLSMDYLVLDTIESDSNCSIEELAAVIQSFSSLGYALDKKGIKTLMSLDSLQLALFYRTYYPLLEKTSGVDVKHIVFYKNFPKLENVSDLEYYVRAILHYLTVALDTDVFMNQDIKDFERSEVHNIEKQVLKIISVEEAHKIIVKKVENIFESNVAISYSNLLFLEEALLDYGNSICIKKIPFKENIAQYFRILSRINNDKKMKDYITKETLSFVKTPIDLLRVYAALSYGDITLRQNTIFISLERCVRRVFLSILDDMAKTNSSIYDNLSRHDFLWKKVFEKLHVGEYKSRYPYIAEVASNFRNDLYETYYSQLNSSFDNQAEYIRLLKMRPGEFARRLDMLVRKESYDLDYTLSEFKKVAGKVSTTLLLQLWEFYKNRNLYPTRVFKINLPHAEVFKEIDDLRNSVSDEVCDKVIKVIEEVLTDIYSNYEYKGKVYIDPNIKDYCLPVNSRNGSAQNKTLTFGTKIKLDPTEGNFLRFFTHFKNISYPDGGTERIDVDLSIEFVTEDFSQSFTLGWHNMGGGREFNSFHSGDITDAPEGASEFVDLDYKQAIKYARYAIVTNSSYTSQDFCDIPECFSGVMFMDEFCKEGEIFNPEFVKHKFTLTQKDSNLNIAFAIDLKTMEMIWIDSPLSEDGSYVVAARSYDVILVLKNALKEHMSLYDFFLLHCKHMEIVDNKEEADIIISDSPDATIKPYDVAEIASDWL